MALDAGSIAKVKDWIAAKSHGRGCSWCGGHEFEVHPNEVVLDEEGHDLGSLIAVQCSGCEQTFLFSTRIA